MYMKNGLFTTMLNTKDHGVGVTNLAKHLKNRFHQIRLCCQCNGSVKGIVYYELPLRNQSINSYVYCCYLDKFNNAIEEKRPELEITRV